MVENESGGSRGGLKLMKCSAIGACSYNTSIEGGVGGGGGLKLIKV